MAASVSSCAVATPKVTAVPASLSSSRSAVNGGRVVVAFPCNAIAAKSIAVSCRASAEEEDSSVVTRRSALALLAGVAAVSSRVSPADAAYGEAANVFGAPKQQSGFTPYSGEGFTVNIPTKWNPSKEVEFPGQVLRFEDNFDQLSNLSVSILPSDKKSIKDYGSPEEFLKKVSYLLGKQSYQGKTSSEGGFDPDSVASASIFNSDVKELGGKSYYDLSLLTRTGDGNEGGRHQSIVATVSDGKLYIFKAQAGDKRWFKGTQKFVEGAAKSFAVA